MRGRESKSPVFLKDKNWHGHSLQAGSSVENGARSKHKGAIFNGRACLQANMVKKTKLDV